MAFDYGSVLLAVGVAGVALCFTFASNWVRQPQFAILGTWTLTMGLIVGSVVTFSIYSAGGADLYGLTASLFLTSGFAVGYGGVTQFRGGRFPTALVIGMSAAMAVSMIAPFALGFDAISFVLVNFLSAVVLSSAGASFWQARSESPFLIGTIGVMHWVLALSFLACAVMIMVENPLVLDGPPESWAEVVNLLCCVVTITVVGGLLITVHQERIARAHHTASITDALTGLLNRRAMFDRFEDGMVRAGTAMAIFDLDDFKGLNDRHGHAVGDRVLLAFADVLRRHARDDDLIARLGGEEFTIIMPDTSSDSAREAADRVRSDIAQMGCETETGSASCTVSAGVAVAAATDESLDSLTRKADTALYLSKRNGRNQVTCASPLAAA